MFYSTLQVDLLLASTKQNIYFIDFETTGLCKSKDYIVVASLLHFCHNTCTLHQWQIENLDEEILLLRSLLGILTSNSSIYNYNGRQFELAFLKSKIDYYHLEYDYPWQWIDFKDLPSFKSFTKLSRHYNRLFFEQLTGFTRCVSTPGKERAKIAKLILQHPNPAYTHLLLTYSKEEVFSLVKFYQLHQFLVQITSRNFLSKHLSQGDENNPLPQKLLFILSCQYPVDFNLKLNLPPYELDYIAYETTVSLTIHTRTDTLLHYLNPREYFIVNNELLHSSLASFIPPALKRRPKKDECFLKQTGTFIPTSLSTSDKIWIDSHKSPYILVTPNTDYLSAVALFCERFRKNK